MIPLLATLFLIPGTHQLAAPGPLSIPLAGPSYLHLRWKSDKASGYWAPPTLNLPSPGTYWISAATKPVVRAFKATDFEQLLRKEGITMVQQYRRQYKLSAQPSKILASEYAKTMVEVGNPRPITAITLNLPVELILLHPQLIQLNFRGQPLYDIQINMDGSPIGRTNGAGQLPLPSLSRATKMSATVVRSYPDHSTADWEFFTATLTLPQLDQRQAAIDNGQLPRHKRAGSQVEEHRIGNIIACTKPPGWSLSLQLLQGSSPRFFKRNSTGSNAIDANLRSPGPRHRASHMNDAGFGGAIVHMHGPGLNPADRRDVDNPPPALLAQHLTGGLLSAKKVSLQIRGMYKVPIRLCDQQRIYLRKPSGIIDQTINRPNLAKQAFNLRDFGEVRLKDRSIATLSAQFEGCVARPTVVNQNGSPLRIQAPNDSPSNPFSTPGNEHASTMQSSKSHPPPIPPNPTHTKSIG